MSTTTRIDLYPKDFDAISSIGRFGRISTEQLLTLHYAENKNRRSGMNRLALLTSCGFVSREPCYPSVKTTHHIGRPTNVYYWTSSNQRRLQSWFEEHGRASEWHDRKFDDLAALQSDTTKFSSQYLAHEVGITEFFIRLEHATAATGGAVHLVFWRRTSPFAKDIGKELFIEKPKRRMVNGQWVESTEQHKRSFHPDGVFCLRGKDEKGNFHNFFFLEFDNNSAAPDRYTQKLEGYQAYWKQQHFPALLAQLITDYALPIRSDLSKIGFRVLTVTPIPSRRDILFQASLELRQFSMFYFAALPDLAPDRLLSNVWMRGKEYAAIEKEEKELAPTLSPSVRSRWLAEKLAHMPRVSL